MQGSSAFRVDSTGLAICFVCEPSINAAHYFGDGFYVHFMALIVNGYGLVWNRKALYRLKTVPKRRGIGFGGR